VALLPGGTLSVKGGGSADFLKVSSERKSPEKILFPKIISLKRGKTRVEPK